MAFAVAPLPASARNDGASSRGKCRLVQRRARVRVAETWQLPHTCMGMGTGMGRKKDGWEAAEEVPKQPHEDGEVPAEIDIELVDGFFENAKVRPRIDLDADEYMLMWKLRRLLHEDDFERIFSPKNPRIGEF